MDTKFQKKHESDMTKKERRELEREKLASMNGKEKLEYILTYYKLQIGLVLGAILLIVGVVKWIDSFFDETVLYAAIVNGRNLEEGMMEEFQAYRGDENRRHKYILDTSIAFQDQDGSGEMDYATATKMLTLVGSSATDLFICPKSVYEKYSQEEDFLVPVEQLLGEEFVASHEDICEKDAVRVEKSEILERYGYQSQEAAYLIVFQYSSNHEAAADFVKFLTGENLTGNGEKSKEN